MAEKTRILSTFNTLWEENKCINKSTKQVAQIFEINNRTVHKINRGGEKGLFSPPKKPAGRSAKIDEFDNNAIRRVVHQFFYQNELPT